MILMQYVPSRPKPVFDQISYISRGAGTVDFRRHISVSCHFAFASSFLPHLLLQIGLTSRFPLSINIVALWPVGDIYLKLPLLHYSGARDMREAHLSSWGNAEVSVGCIWNLFYAPVTQKVCATMMWRWIPGP